MKGLLLGIVFILWGGGPAAPSEAAVSGAARLVDVESSVSADTATVGQRIRVRHRIVFPDSLELVPPATFDTGTCRVIDVRWRRGEAKGAEIHTVDLSLLPMDLENAHLPAVPFRFRTPSGDTLTFFSREIDVPIRSLAEAEADLRGLKPQWKAPRGFRYLYILAGLLALSLLAAYLWRKRRRAEAAAPSRPELPCDFVALRALAEIEKLGLPEKGEFKKYYTLVVDALRHYLERRFGVEAMDRTTGEILHDLERIRVDADGLGPLLAEADLVKFAKFRPDIATGKRAMEKARDFVGLTAPSTGGGEDGGT